MWAISCNLLNTILKAKNRMDTEQFYMCPLWSLTDWELLLLLPSIMREAHHISLAWKKSKIQSVGLLVQDGGVENVCSSPPLRLPKSPLPIEQPSIEGCWNIPKKDTPCPKTKKKPQQDGRRSTIMIKSNPIPTRLVTYKLENNNNKEVLPLL